MTGDTNSSYGVGTRPPTWPFVLSVVTIACSVGLAVISYGTVNPLPKNTIGWLLGGVFPVLFLITYRLRDRALRARTDYTLTAHGNARMAILTVIGLGVGGYHGWFVAEWLAS